MRVDEEAVMLTLRALAWERAKGEMRSMLSTYWSENDDERKQFEDIKTHIQVFTSIVDDSFF